ncbi:MAG TPA: hypothetical protein DDW27_15185 [Bacteroidales bacterium]|nr:hypothetical protein [Bacteroidales bacterium]
MNLKIFTIISILAAATAVYCQTDTEINKTDPQGRKQGHWIARYPNGNILYEGFFKDNYPVGELKRYYNDQSINSVMIFSGDGKESDATIYYPDGSIAARGKYVNRMKEGKWKFYSSTIPGYLLNEEEYSKNLRHGLSVKFYTDSTIAEKITYKNDRKEGEWIQYYASGNMFLRSVYSGGYLNGKFEVWFENGIPEITGFYKNNLREGKWTIFNEDGTIKYVLNYTLGMTKDRKMDLDAEKIIDNLEKNKGKIPDPEKTGEFR